MGFTVQLDGKKGIVHGKKGIVKVIIHKNQENERGRLFETKKINIILLNSWKIYDVL